MVHRQAERWWREGLVGGTHRYMVQGEQGARKGSLGRGAGTPRSQDRELRVHTQAAGSFHSHHPGWRDEESGELDDQGQEERGEGPHSGGG